MLGRDFTNIPTFKLWVIVGHGLLMLVTALSYMATKTGTGIAYTVLMRDAFRDICT